MTASEPVQEDPKPERPPTPELDRALTVKEDAQKIGAFLDNMPGMVLARRIWMIYSCWRLVPMSTKQLHETMLKGGQPVSTDEAADLMSGTLSSDRICACDQRDGDPTPHGRWELVTNENSINDLLAAYYELDRNKMDREQKALLEYLRALHDWNDRHQQVLT